MANIRIVILRFLAILCDWSIVCIFHSYFLSFGSYSGFYNSFKQLLSDYILVGVFADNSMTELITPVIFIYHLLIFYRLLAALFFGLSPFQALMGFSAISESGVEKRSKGVFRVTLSYFLHPLLVTDFSLFSGIPTLKERVTNARLELTRESTGLTFSIIVPPLMVILMFYAPLLEKLTLLDGIKVSFYEKQREKLAEDGHFNKYKNYYSNYFRFSTFSSLQDNRYILLPSFEVKLENKRRIIKPHLIIYDKKNKTKGAIRIGEKYDLFKLLKRAQFENPLFKYRYPRLANAIDAPSEYYMRKEYKTEYRGKTLISKDLQSEIRALVEDSLKLGRKNYLDHFLNNGPFVRGHINLRSAILKQIGEDQVPKASMRVWGDQYFLSLQHEVREGEKVTDICENIISLATNNSYLIQAFFPNTKKGVESLDNFLESFFDNAEWYFDYKDIFSFPREQKHMNPMNIVDFFMHRDLDELRVRSFGNFIYHYFFDLSKMSLVKNDPVLKEILVKVLKRYQSVGRMVNRSMKRYYYSKDFIISLRVLRNSLKADDTLFFNIQNDLEDELQNKKA
jgi:hypothetical protein